MELNAGVSLADAATGDIDEDGGVDDGEDGRPAAFAPSEDVDGRGCPSTTSGAFDMLALSALLYEITKLGVGRCSERSDPYRQLFSSSEACN